MLPRQMRLNAVEIEALFKGKAQVFKTDFFTVRAQIEDTDPGAPKGAVVVSAKTLKLAVKRNLAKRRVRHALRQVLPECVPGAKVVIVVNLPALTESLEGLVQRINNSFTALNLIQK